MLGAMPEMTAIPTVSDAVRQPMVSTSNLPFIPKGLREGGKGKQ